MCTCIDFKTKDFYFGRTLDLEYRYKEQVCITPRGYNFNLKNGNKIKTKYALIGIATVIKDYPMYYEACNEKGLCMAGLNFPKTCVYNDPLEGKLNITPFELIPYFLGLYKSVKEVKEEIKNLNITNLSYMEGFPLTSLHFMFSDCKESIVVEQTIDGLKVYDNPVGVMTNNPSFDYQIKNLNNYMTLTASYGKNNFANNIKLEPYGVGMGAIGLPGDYSPASRFVKACFIKQNSVCDDDEISSVTQFFHILDSVSFVKGAIITQNNRYDITTYSCCINASKGIYYYKTYYNNQINRVMLNDSNMNSNKLTIYDLCLEQNINSIN